MVQSLKNSGVASATGPKSGLVVRFPASPLMSLFDEGEADPIRVLIVEDDESYREIVSSELEWHGFAFRSFADGDELLGSLDAVGEADVIVLDWRLPTISGIDLLPRLRRRGVNLPVVFLTSHADPTYEKLAFERGALDFIDKTRGVEILASRLRLAVKSGKPAATPEAENPIICGKLILSPSTGRRANVPLSSRPMMREWPTTSAVTIAASLRCSRTREVRRTEDRKRLADGRQSGEARYAQPATNAASPLGDSFTTVHNSRCHCPADHGKRSENSRPHGRLHC